MQASILFSAIALSTLLVVANAPAETPQGSAQATFIVHCYDIGAGALSRKTGVISVERGWRGPREVDRVVYDPHLVTLMQLENWLKEADTYISTLESTKHTLPEKGMPQ